MKKAVILFSGGLDSTTVLAMAHAQEFELYALSFDYGQRHSVELNCVQKILKKYPIQDHQLVRIDLRQFGGSALTDEIQVPKSKAFDAESKKIPITYVPARNTIFLSFALAYAETLGAKSIFLGINSLDYSNYPDCRPEYLSAFERMANLATALGVEEGGIQFHAPLLRLTKAEIIREGLKLGVDYSMTNSCYDPSEEGKACGACDACHLRLAGFQQNGLVDPIQYQSIPESPMPY
ncbi:MAG: 7-cyano-7-deazaguanine synthase QueC [Bdellovibrionia bacterium]